MLGFFKYTDFFLENFNLFTQLAHLDFSIPLPHILLPLALSFVTFQQIAFLVDCYRHCALSDEGNFSCTQSSAGLESSAGLKSKAFIESIPTDSRSHQSSESSLLDSHSHGYFLDSQNRFVFSQKEKGYSPFCEKTQDSKKLENIRENTTQRNLESTESRTFTESSRIDSETITKSKEILKNAQKQNLESTTFKADLESNNSLDSINFLDYCLFITFFPQLIAGPIVHHKEMMPQFARLGHRSDISSQIPECQNGVSNASTESTNLNSQKSAQKTTFCDYESVAKGLFIFAIGLFKKVCIADSFAVWANAGFSVVENGGVLNLFESWATSLSYTFELYFDFSGYCDMAVGLGLLFGILLPLNFNSPYKALNIADFWRRWHITLGRFLKEYVYIPLGGNKNSSKKVRANSALSDKSLNLRSGLGHYPLGNSLRPSLDSNDFSSQILEFRVAQSQHVDSATLECKKSNVGLESSFTDSESKQPKNLRTKKQEGGAVFFNDFCGCGARGAGSYLSGSDQTECEHSAKSTKKTSQENSLYNQIFTLRNLFIVAFLSGVWHGAGWGFVLWDALHGVAMCVHRIYMWWYQSLEKQCSFSDFRNSACTQSLNECGGSARSLTPSKLPSPRLAQHLNLTHNPRISGKPSAECKTDSESNSTNSDSKQLTESTTSKNLCEALPNINNSACASTSRAESMPIDSAIFAQQKSNKYVGAIAPTISRPCRGGKNALKKCSSAFLAFLTRQGDSEALPLFAEKEKRRFIFFGAKGSGEGINPFFFCDTQDSKKQRSIRENESLRNAESSAENLGNTDSKTRTESKAEILNNTQPHSFARFYTAFRHTRFYTIVCWLVTFNFVNIAWIFFRAQNLQGALNLLEGMFGGVVVLPSFLESKLGFLGLTQINGAAIGFGGWLQNIGGSWESVLALIAATIICVCCANSLALMRNMRKSTIIICAIAFAHCLIVLTTSDYQAPFLYFNF